MHPPADRGPVPVGGLVGAGGNATDHPERNPALPGTTTISQGPATSPPADWIEPQPWLVTSARVEAPDVVTLAFAPPTPFRFEPGQFNMVSLPGLGEVPISISSDPAAGTRVLHTIRDVGPVTKALCALRPGQRAGVRGPYGTSWPVAEAIGGDLVIVAGGIGLPPLRPALYQALRDRDRFGRITLLYGARTPVDLLFRRELGTWRGRDRVDVRVTVDAAGHPWTGQVGVVPALIPAAGLAPEVTTAFVVGPEVMMRFTVRALLAAGVTAGRIFLSMERNMQCAVALCGHCQLGPFLVCRDGPVFRYADVARWLSIREL
jgi:NAD(P)H-flavin reductase